MDNENNARLEERLAQLRAQVTPIAFAPGFTDRVMSRLAADGEIDSPHRAPTALDALPRMFARIVPLAAAALLVVSAINLHNTRTVAQPFVERVLGIPAVTVADAYAIDADLAMWGDSPR